MSPRTLAACALAALATASTVPSSAQVADYRDLEYPPLPDFSIPAPEIYELANGMKIFLMEDHELPLVTVTARIRTGSLWEPAAKTGLAAIAGAVQRTGGTRSMTGDEIDDFLEARAASVETGIGATVGSATMDCLVEDFDDVLAVFVEVLRYPEFAQDKLDVAKVQANSQIARRNDDIGGITSREFSRLMYGPETALGRLREYATIAAIEREDLIAWHTRFYHPGNVYLGVVGDFAPAAMKRKLEAAFGGWAPGPTADLPAVDYRAENPPGVFFVEKTDVTQAAVRLGHLGIKIDNPDYFAATVLNEVMSGGFSGRLMREIRSTKGLAYGVSGGVGASFLYPGVTGFGLQTKSESVAEAVDALYEELEDVRGPRPPSAEELARAKETILNSFIFNYASKGQVLGQQMLYAYYGLPGDFLERYRENIEKVTVEDLARVAGEYLHPERATLLVVGHAADFDRPLSSFGEVVELDVSIPPPPDTRPPVERSAETAAAGRELFDAVVDRMAGADPAATAAVRRSADIVVSMGGQSMAVRQSILLVFPDRIRVVTHWPMGEQVVVIDGAEGWASAAGEITALAADEVAEQQSELGRDLVYLLRYHDSPDLDVVAAGEGEAEGVACTMLALTFRGAESRICVSADGLVLKQLFRSDHPFTGAPGQFEVILSDYREVEGRMVAHRMLTRFEGEDFTLETLSGIDFDPPRDETLFVRPPA